MSKNLGALSLFLGLGCLGLLPDLKTPTLLEPGSKNSITLRVTNRGGHPAEIACIEFTLEAEEADPPDASRLLSRKLLNLQTALGGLPFRQAASISSILTNSLLLKSYSIATKTNNSEESVIISQEMVLVLPGYSQRGFPFQSQYADYMDTILHYTHRAQGRFELSDATATRFQETLYATTLKQAHAKAKLFLAPPYTGVTLVKIRDDSLDVRIRESGAPDLYAADSMIYYSLDFQAEFSLDK